jgi:hypothetical protein
MHTRLQWHFEKLMHIEIIIFNLQTYKINKRNKFEHLHEPHKMHLYFKTTKQFKKSDKPLPHLHGHV